MCDNRDVTVLCAASLFEGIVAKRFACFKPKLQEGLNQYTLILFLEAFYFYWRDAHFGPRAFLSRLAIKWNVVRTILFINKIIKNQRTIFDILSWIYKLFFNIISKLLYNV